MVRRRSRCLLGQPVQMHDSRLDFRIRQISAATLRRHRVLAASHALDQRRRAGRHARRPGSLVARLWRSSHAAFMAGHADRSINGSAVTRLAIGFGCGFLHFDLGDGLDANVGLLGVVGRRAPLALYR